MALPWIDQLGEWNPQLFREIKGRLVPRNILIAVTVALVGQLLVLMSLANHLPDVPALREDYAPVSNRYCTGNKPYPGVDPLCSLVTDTSFDINWQVWCQDVFVWLSIIGIFALLVGGTYMLVNDLSKEEQRGTLNFLRLSPQSSTSILTGKLLGVPILLYLVVFLALPLHVATGLFGQIPLNLILGFYAVVGASCLLFYSMALLFGLVGNWLGSFQAWLSSGAVLVFLFAMTKESMSRSTIVSDVSGHPMHWVALFNPSIVLSYLTGVADLKVPSIFQVTDIELLQWFSLPVGASVWGVAGLMVLNYGLWTYWVWQGLKRCFHNPSATLLGKQQSYWITACFEGVIVGFCLNPELSSSYSKSFFENYQVLLLFNLLLFLYLIAALSPQRQAMQDWARYRHHMKSSRKRSVLQDLIWGEKSPALVAVGLNLAIASSILLPWILLWPESEYKIPALWGVLVSASLTLVYAAVAQLMLFMKTSKRAVWAAGSVAGLIVLPLSIFAILSVEPEKNSILFLFSALPQVSIEYAGGMSVLLAVIGQSLAFGLLSVQLTQQLQKAGESSTRALLSGRSPVANN